MGYFQIIQKCSTFWYNEITTEDGLHLCNHPSPLSEAQAISVVTTPVFSQTVPETSLFPSTSADIFKQHYLAVHKLY